MHTTIFATALIVGTSSAAEELTDATKSTGLTERLDRRRAWQQFPPLDCSDLVDTCVDQWNQPTCGGGALFPGWNANQYGGAMTPYWFAPNVQNQNCDWMDGDPSTWQTARFSTWPFYQLSNKYSYQSWTSPGSNDVWVLHFCDGAGIQPDCAGDIFYLEHFDGFDAVKHEDCKMSDKSQELNIQCPTFYHPGKDMVLPGYSCGWWRGYDGPVGIEEASFDGVGGNGQTGFGPLPTSDSNSDYSAAIKAVLANCPTCSGGTALEHPYQWANPQPKAYFVGVVYPWICTDNGDDGMIPYTNSGTDCFCDNEPWNGRQDWKSGVDPKYPQGAEYVYCGLYDDHSTTMKLVCDFIRFDVANGQATTEWDDGSGWKSYRGIEIIPDPRGW